MRVTCDTNILVRAAVRPGGPARAVLLEAAISPHFMVLSAEIIDEVSEVLHYDRVRRQANLTDDEIAEFIELLNNLCEMAVPAKPFPAIAGDPDDDLIIATAVHGRADAICTRDRHLRHRLVRAYCATFGIRVLTELELLAELRAAGA